MDVVKSRNPQESVCEEDFSMEVVRAIEGWNGRTQIRMQCFTIVKNFSIVGPYQAPSPLCD